MAVMTEQRAYTAPEVCKIAEVTYRQLDYWDRSDLVSPSVCSARGSGSQRLYSPEDVERVYAIRVLLDAGVSLQAVRHAFVRDTVPEFAEQLSEAAAKLVEHIAS